MKQIEPSLPVLWTHGNADTEVPPSYGQEGVAFLTQCVHIPRGKVSLKLYEGLEHTVNDEVMDDLAE